MRGMNFDLFMCIDCDCGFRDGRALKYLIIAKRFSENEIR